MIPYSRLKLSDLYTLSQSKQLETILFTAAHIYIAHIWQYPPPPGAYHLSRHTTRNSFNTLI